MPQEALGRAISSLLRHVTVLLKLWLAQDSIDHDDVRNTMANKNVIAIQITLQFNFPRFPPPPSTQPHHSPPILINMHALNIPSTLVLLSGPVSIG